MKLPSENFSPPLRSLRPWRFNPALRTQHHHGPIRFASVGQALNTDETIIYYQYVQALQDSLGQAV